LLAKVSNEEAIKSSLRNLVLTGLTERPYQPLVGSKIRASLFSPMSQQTVELIKTTLANTIKFQEPRAKLVNIDVIPDYDNNSYSVSIFFESVNFPGKTFFANIILRALR
jgi:phage baseplate assembly protein W